MEPAVPAVDIPEQLPILPEVDDDTRWRADLKRTNVKSGVLTAAEKETLRSTVEAYAQSKGFSTDDYSWLIVPGKGQRKKHKNTEGVWKIVAAALPNRTIKSVASAGLRMFHPNARLGAWTAEEDAQLRSLVEERGRQWSEIGAALGRARWSCRDRWREIKLGDSRGKGPWTEEETEKLKAAVEEYQAMKAGGEQGDKGGDGDALDRRIVLDDINWEAISAKVGTRSHIQCLEKWYDQLRPSMVATGDWGAGDDRRMLRALWSLWGCAEYEVPWGEVVKGRTAAQARRRWRLMCKAVPDVRDMEFPDVVDWLVDKYLPHLKDKGTVGEEEAAAAAS